MADKPDADFVEWLSNKARAAREVQVATHPVRATYPKAHVNETTSPFVQWDELPQHQEIGTHDLKHKVWDIPGNSASSLPLGKFLLGVVVDGQPLIHWLLSGDADFVAALSDDGETATRLATEFRQIDHTSQSPASHLMAKQIYWLAGSEPTNNAQFIQLQPCFSIGMSLVLYDEINATYGRNETEDHKRAREAYFKREPDTGTYRQYRDLAYLKVGGSHPKNVSYQYQKMGGRNYLLASLPPRWTQSRTRRPLNPDDVWNQFHHFGEVRALVKLLADFLKTDPPPTMETRQKREAIETELGQQLAIFAAFIHNRFDPGWTRASDCELHDAEKLWLDPERIELPPREGFEAADEAFIAAYERGDWPDEIAGRFALWLNARLRDAGITDVGDSEAKHWARQAIVEADWPATIQRRMPTGGIA